MSVKKRVSWRQVTFYGGEKGRWKRAGKRKRGEDPGKKRANKMGSVECCGIDGQSRTWGTRMGMRKWVKVGWRLSAHSQNGGAGTR